MKYLASRTPEQKQKPFFAYLPFAAPHWPLQCTPEDRKAYAGMYDDGPDALRLKRLARLAELGIVRPDAEAYPVVTTALGWEEMSEYERKCSARSMEVYAGMITSMDRAVGTVIDYLAETGELDNTFVVFMSDNGAEGAALGMPAYRLFFVVFAPCSCAHNQTESKGVMTDFTRDIDEYYDNSYENLGNHNSYCWYGPR